MLASFSVSKFCNIWNIKQCKGISSPTSFLKEADKKIKKMKEDCDELLKEVIQRKAEVNAMKEDILSKQKLMIIDKKEVEKLLEVQDSLKVTQN